MRQILLLLLPAIDVDALIWKSSSLLQKLNKILKRKFIHFSRTCRYLHILSTALITLIHIAIIPICSLCHGRNSWGKFKYL